ncbi:hypothetical protein FACS1894106_1440 [Spirochaetia bacterium]|nr:hypothetical protein FACS1894106_1440 [Spirochaetia bacterium]
MSKVSELQIAQVGYEAGKMAIEKTKPEILTVDIVYEKEGAKINPGRVSYAPIRITWLLSGCVPIQAF